MCAYLVHSLMGGGKGVLQGFADVHAARDSVDGVVYAVEGLSWPGGGVLPCVRACLNFCVGGWDGPDQGCGRRAWPAPLDPLGRSERGQPLVVARLTRGDSGQRAGQGLVSRLEDTPEDPVWAGGFPQAPGGAVPEASMLSVPLRTR